MATYSTHVGINNATFKIKWSLLEDIEWIEALLEWLCHGYFMFYAKPCFAIFANHTELNTRKYSYKMEQAPIPCTLNNFPPPNMIIEKTKHIGYACVILVVSWLGCTQRMDGLGPWKQTNISAKALPKLSVLQKHCDIWGFPWNKGKKTKNIK